MTRRTYLLMLIGCILTGCRGKSGVTIHWKDGNYRVYTRPTSKEIIIGYYMGDGGILGLSNPTVVAAGSDSRYVVFRREPESGTAEYYYIEKEASGEGKVHGPLGEKEYASTAKASSLPEYSWHLNR